MIFYFCSSINKLKICRYLCYQVTLVCLAVGLFVVFLLYSWYLLLFFGFPLYLFVCLSCCAVFCSVMFSFSSILPSFLCVCLRIIHFSITNLVLSPAFWYRPLSSLSPSLSHNRYPLSLLIKHVLVFTLFVNETFLKKKFSHSDITDVIHLITSFFGYINILLFWLWLHQHIFLPIYKFLCLLLFIFAFCNSLFFS